MHWDPSCSNCNQYRFLALHASHIPEQHSFSASDHIGSVDVMRHDVIIFFPPFALLLLYARFVEAVA